MDEKATELRPVRRSMTKAKKRQQITKDMSSMVTQEDLEYRVEDHEIAKTPEELAEIELVVKNNYLFNHLKPHQR